MKHCAVVVSAVVLISFDAVLGAVEETEWRGAPWWRALRAESYYKQCHSSCTEFSQGIKTTVELCDDSEVGVDPCMYRCNFERTDQARKYS